MVCDCGGLLSLNVMILTRLPSLDANMFQLTEPMSEGIRGCKLSEAAVGGATVCPRLQWGIVSASLKIANCIEEVVWQQPKRVCSACIDTVQ